MHNGHISGLWVYAFQLVIIVELGIIMMGFVLHVIRDTIYLMVNVFNPLNIIKDPQILDAGGGIGKTRYAYNVQ